MQLYLRLFYIIIRQQNNFECTLEHQKNFRLKSKTYKQKFFKYNPRSKPTIYAMCDASIVELAQHFYNRIKQTEFHISKRKTFYSSKLETLYINERMHSNNIYTNRKWIFNPWFKESKSFNYTFWTKFFFAQKSCPNHRVHRFQKVSTKVPISHKVWTAGKNLSIPDTVPCSLNRWFAWCILVHSFSSCRRKSGDFSHMVIWSRFKPNPRHQTQNQNQIPKPQPKTQVIHPRQNRTLTTPRVHLNEPSSPTSNPLDQSGNTL